MPDAPANPFPVACFFQPARNVAAMVALGVNVFFGPEVENAKSLTPDALAAGKAAWVKAVADVGAACVLKGWTGPLPGNCVGVLTTVDEPNGRGVPAASIKPEVDALRAAYPGVSVFISLAGDKITSANLRKPAELQALTDYLNLADLVTVDAYAKNRNASRYSTTWTADAVKTIKAVRPAVKCWAWIETNDQILPAPTSQTTPGVTDINREPTPDEIKQSVDAVLAQGVDGIGWFFTCDSGKYGWGVGNTDFATRGDSYLPLINRKGDSMAPQYAMVLQISKSLNPPPDPAPVPDDKDAQIAALTRQVADLAKEAADAKDQYAVKAARVAELQTAVRAFLDASDARDAALSNLGTAAK